MNCLVYCIFPAHEQRYAMALPTGVAGGEVLLVSQNDLCAAVSYLDPRDCTPGRDKLLAFKRVVDALHREGTVIPMRYGCFLDDIPAVRGFLDDRREEYSALLQQLAGCVEMGIRVLPDASDQVVREQPRFPSGHEAQGGLGHAYLESRKAHYRQIQLSADTRGGLIEQGRTEFSGLFRKLKWEEASVASPMLSLYFLVPRDLVEAFRERFRKFGVRKTARVLLSGPWPPYNFVQAEGEERAVQDRPGGSSVEGLWFQ